MKSNQQNRAYKIILILFIILTYIATPICAFFNLLTFTYISYICQAIAVFLFLLAFRTERIPADSESEPLSITGEEQKHLADEQALRIRELRAEEASQADPEAAQRLRQRAAALVPLLVEAQELAGLTAHYYDRSYHPNGKYTL